MRYLARLYSVTDGLEPVTGDNQEGRQSKVTAISPNQPSSQTERTLHG